MPSRSSRKKKKWHLADSMDFIEPYVGYSKKSTSNSNPIIVNVPSHGENLSDDDEDKDAVKKIIEERLDHSPRKKGKTGFSLITKTNRITCMKGITQVADGPKDDSLQLFIKSLYGDLKKLSSKRQRKFKTVILQELNSLLDEEEEESRRSSNCNHSQSQATSSPSISTQ